MSNPAVRVRFAPSPTGYVHVGNARTALFNWLFARHHGGAFVLRIEDTDAERSEARYEAQLIEDLKWFGLEWEEGPDVGGPFAPYRQSDRLDLYSRHAHELIDRGHAYFCFCTPEQLEAEREAALKAGRQPRYSGRCRHRPREEAARKVAEGQPASIRLKIEGSAFTWKDLVHGLTTFSTDVIGDFILMRSDGHPAYNYAVVIDDHAMEITHVIRGDDHVSNTPRQLAVYEALGWSPPEFAHLSTILGADRTRLSKRHGATSLENFRKMGILPEALRNYLLLLGWSAQDGKTEILSTKEMIEQFSLERVNKSPAVFDQKKLNWLNSHYLLQRPVTQQFDRFMNLVEGVLIKRGYIAQSERGRDREFVARILSTTLAANPKTDREKVLELMKLIFEYDARETLASPAGRSVSEDPGAREVLKAFIPKLVAEPELTYARFRQAATEVQSSTGKKGRELFHPIRVALTGAESGPELKDLIPVFEEGAQLRLHRPVKSCAERLREFAAAAELFEPSSPPAG